MGLQNLWQFFNQNFFTQGTVISTQVEELRQNVIPRCVGDLQRKNKIKMKFTLISAIELAKVIFLVNGLADLTFVTNQITSRCQADVYLPGTSGFDKYRLVNNGLCNSIKPGLVVRPRTTKDVSTIVRVARRFGLEISVRSGGHSYTCTNLRQGTRRISCFNRQSFITF